MCYNLSRRSISRLMKYNLAVSSKIPLADASGLSRPAYLLGQRIAASGHTLLSPVRPSLVYQVAIGVSDKAGLSIGFSPAGGVRQHVRGLCLPDDAYDWLCYAGCDNAELLAMMIRNSQGLILVGGVLDNLSELALAADSLMPAGILIDVENQANNDLLRYLQSLPLEKQKRIVVHKDPGILLDTLSGMLDQAYADCRPAEIAQNNRLFKELIENSGKLAG